jgi:hypothetical protein
MGLLNVRAWERRRATDNGKISTMAYKTELEPRHLAVLSLSIDAIVAYAAFSLFHL